MEFKLRGYIAGDTFKSQGNSHFADIETGKVICGTQNRFGMDCAMEIRITDWNHYETDDHQKFSDTSDWNLRKNSITANDGTVHAIPIELRITCKKCLAKMRKILAEK